MDDPADDAVGFHLAKLLDEHLLGNGGNRSTELREAQHVATEEMKQDHQLPAALENLESVFNATRGGSRRQLIALTFR